jgi:exodeoxyribonuclease V beta subunit
VAPAAGAARRSARAGEHWWIASYSALKTEGEDGGCGSASAAETPNEAVFQEAVLAVAQNAVSEADDSMPPPGARTARQRRDRRQRHSRGGSLHDFPRGAEAGTFLHDLLEWSARQGFGRAPAIRRCSAT